MVSTLASLWPSYERKASVVNWTAIAIRSNRADSLLVFVGLIAWAACGHQRAILWALL